MPGLRDKSIVFEKNGSVPSAPTGSEVLLFSDVNGNLVVKQSSGTVNVLAISGTSLDSSAVASLTGSLQTQLDDNQSTLSVLTSVSGASSGITTAAVASLTGNLQTQITAINIIDVAQQTTLSQITSVSGSFLTSAYLAPLTGSLNVRLTDVELNNAVQSSNIQNLSASVGSIVVPSISGYATLAAVASLTGSLQSQVIAITVVDASQQTTLSQLTSVSGSFSTISTVASLTGSLKTSITDIELNNAIQSTNIQSISANYSTSSSVNSLTGSLQTQILAITAVDAGQQFTLSQLTSLSGTAGLGWNRTEQEFSSPNTLIGGYTWEPRTSAADNFWQSVCYGNGIYVAVSADGTGNRVMTSPDGITWTTRTSAADNQWKSVCYGNGLFVAVATSGSGNRVMTSPDGINWTIGVSAADNVWNSVCYGNGLFVAVSSNQSTYDIMTSYDGVTWTLQPVPYNRAWSSVCYGNGKFVAVNSNANFAGVMVSKNGINWQIVGPPYDRAWSSVCYGNGKFVAVAGNNSDGVMTSPDGLNWTGGNSGSTTLWRSICFGNGLFVVVSASGVANGVMTSTDGIAWTIRTIPVNQVWTSVCYGNGKFVAVASTGSDGKVMTSGGALTFLGNFTASRNLTVPNASFTLAGQDYANTFSAPQIVDLGTGTSSVSSYPAVQQSGITLIGGISGTVSPTIRGAAWNASSLSLIGQGASGTRVSPSGMPDGTAFINMLAYGHNGTAYTTAPAARYIMSAHGTWTASNNGAFHVWTGTPSGSTTATEWMRLQNAGLSIGGVASVDSTNKLNVYGTSLIDTGTGTLPTALCTPQIRIAAADNVGARITGESWGTTGLLLWGRGAGGIRGTPTATPDGTGLIGLNAVGYDIAPTNGSSGGYRVNADGLWSAANNGVYHIWLGTPKGSIASAAEWMRLQNGNLGIGAAPITGAGTLQVAGSALFDRGTGTLLTLTGTPGITIAGSDDTSMVMQTATWRTTDGAGFRFNNYRPGGTRASPLATPATAQMAAIGSQGHDGISAQAIPAALYLQNAGSLWSAANRETTHTWEGTPIGSTSRSIWMTLQNASLGVGIAPITGNGVLQVAGAVLIDFGSGSTGVSTANNFRAFGADTGVLQSAYATFGNANGPTFVTYNIGGTRAAQSATLNASALIGFATRGHDGTAQTGTKGAFSIIADGLWSGANTGTIFQLGVTPNGSTTFNYGLRYQSHILTLDGGAGGLAPTTGNGFIQLASGTTKANGIAFGDWNVYRVGSGDLYSTPATGTDGYFSILRSTGERTVLGVGSGTAIVGAATNHPLALITNGASRFAISADGLSVFLFDGMNFVAGTTTGTKFGGATNQKVGFWGATPIVQPTGYGSPASSSLTPNFPGTAATLAQCGGAISDLIIKLKLMGLLGA